MIVGDGGPVPAPRHGAGPDGVQVRRALPAVLVVRDEEGRPLRPEHRAVQDLRDEAGHERVADRDVAIVHVVAEVRREPHVVRGVGDGVEIVEEGLVRGTRGDDARAARGVPGKVAVVDERIVLDRVPPGVAAVAVRRHGLQVGLPREAGVDESAHDVRGVPGGPGARVGPRMRVRGAAEGAGRRQAEVVREARHGTLREVRRQARIVREARQVRRGPAAGREDLADPFVLHHDGDDVVEEEARRTGGDSHPRGVEWVRPNPSRRQQGDGRGPRARR